MLRIKSTDKGLGWGWQGLLWFFSRHFAQFKVSFKAVNFMPWMKPTVHWVYWKLWNFWVLFSHRFWWLLLYHLGQPTPSALSLVLLRIYSLSFVPTYTKMCYWWSRFSGPKIWSTGVKRKTYTDNILFTNISTFLQPVRWSEVVY